MLVGVSKSFSHPSINQKSCVDLRGPGGPFRVFLVKRLEKAWDLLDELPNSVADEEFVRSTVEIVALEAQQEAETLRARSAWPRRVNMLAIGAMVLFAAFLGYRMVDQYSGATDDGLARDLPVIEDLDLYRRLDDVEFLRKLHEEGLFEEETKDAS